MSKVRITVVVDEYWVSKLGPNKSAGVNTILMEWFTRFGAASPEVTRIKQELLADTDFLADLVKTAREQNRLSNQTNTYTSSTFKPKIDIRKAEEYEYMDWVEGEEGEPNWNALPEYVWVIEPGTNKKLYKDSSGSIKQL